MASAMTVSIGLIPIGPGNRLASATNRPGTPWNAPKLSVTPRRGSSFIRAHQVHRVDLQRGLRYRPGQQVPQLARAADLRCAVEGEQHPAGSGREQRLPGQLDATDQAGRVGVGEPVEDLGPESGQVAHPPGPPCR
jgi:hypothetical protein